MTAAPPDVAGTMPAYRERVMLDDGALVVSEARCDPLPVPPVDAERSRRLSIVFELSGVFVRHTATRRGRRETISDPAHALVFRPDEPYRVSHPLGGLDRSIDIAVPRSTLDDMAIEPGGLPDAVAIDGLTHVLIRRWAAAIDDGLDPLSAGETAMTLIDRVLRPTLPRAGSREGDRLIDRTRLVIADRLGDRLTLPELGTVVGSSPFHLARRFRAATGMSIHAYRTTLRVRAALSRIEQGETDLTTLALDLGFAHHSHLTTTVRRHAGRPPSRFRSPPTRSELRRLRTILQA
jgi:AraC-like DNA-binding protein